LCPVARSIDVAAERLGDDSLCGQRRPPRGLGTGVSPVGKAAGRLLTETRTDGLRPC
jgi:hypothetical protein